MSKISNAAVRQLLSKKMGPGIKTSDGGFIIASVESSSVWGRNKGLQCKANQKH